MTDSLARASRETGGSFGHLLLVWLLVGYSFMALGWDLAETLPVAIPLAPIDAGLLVGTLVVCVLWITGVRPTVRTALAYFVVHAVVRVAATVFFLAVPGQHRGRGRRSASTCWPSPSRPLAVSPGSAGGPSVASSAGRERTSSNQRPRRTTRPVGDVGRPHHPALDGDE